MSDKWESACKAGTDTAKDWNAYLNIHPPLPNHKYTINTVDYTFETDALGRVNKVTATLDNTERGRNLTQQGLAVSLKDGIVGDEGGHLIANILNGPGEQLNYVAMKDVLNGVAWKNMETEWKNAIRGNPNANPPIPSVTVTIEIEIDYGNVGNSKRPDNFVVRYTSGTNLPVRRTFQN